MRTSNLFSFIIYMALGALTIMDVYVYAANKNIVKKMLDQKTRINVTEYKKNGSSEIHELMSLPDGTKVHVFQKRDDNRKPISSGHLTLVTEEGIRKLK